MKPLTIAIGASLALNAAIPWFIVGRSESKDGAVGVTSGHHVAAQAGKKALNLAVAKPARNTSHEAQRDRLLELGFPPDVVRAVIRATIEEPRMARQRKFYADAAAKPWWQRSADGQDLTREQQREVNQLIKAEREEISRVLGVEATVSEGDLERFGFLGTDKAIRLASLERDYSELRQEAFDSGAPTQQRALLDEEYKRDVAALLTPEEKARFDERESSTARNLGYRFEYFPGTEAEYKAFFGLQKAFDDAFPASTLRDSDKAKLRGPAQQELNKNIKSALGPDRYDAFLAAQRPEYRALVDLQRRFDVPQQAFDQISRLQIEITRTGAQIAADESMERDSKKRALADLANRARNEVNSALGPALGGKYLAATSSSWVDLLSAGKVYGAQPTGGTFTSEVAPERPPPKPAK